MIHLILDSDFLIYSRHSIKPKNFGSTSFKAAVFEPKKGDPVIYLNFDKVILDLNVFPIISYIPTQHELSNGQLELR